MFPHKTLFFFLALCGAIRISVTENCKKCLPNLAYCIDETHFYACGDGSNPSITEQSYECPSGTFCSNSPDICAAANSPYSKACSSNADCNRCGGRRFACVSKTEFAFCRNDVPSTVSSCGEGEVCSIGLYDDPTENKLCASEIVLEWLNYSATCNNAEASTNAPPATTTQSPANLAQQCTDSKDTNRYFYILNKEDSTCKSYIYCERRNNGMEGQLFTCKSGYFDTKTKRCVEKKPPTCPTTNF